MNMLTKKYPTTIYLTDGRELIPYIEPWEEDMFDLENKLIRANKKLRNLRRCIQTWQLVSIVFLGGFIYLVLTV